MNKVVLIGRLTADPKCGTTAGGKKYARFSLAVSRMDADNNADFLNIVAWEKSAETADKYLVKGKQVAIVGHIQTGTYERDGVKRPTFDIIAERIEFVGGRDDGTQNQGSGAKADELKEVDAADDDMPF